MKNWRGQGGMLEPVGDIDSANYYLGCTTFNPKGYVIEIYRWRIYIISRHQSLPRHRHGNVLTSSVLLSEGTGVERGRDEGVGEEDDHAHGSPEIFANKANFDEFAVDLWLAVSAFVWHVLLPNLT